MHCVYYVSMASHPSPYMTSSAPLSSAKILYCAPNWYRFSSAADLNKLESFLRHCKRSGYCKQDMPMITEQVDDADNSLFHSIIANKHHVLQR